MITPLAAGLLVAMALAVTILVESERRGAPRLRWVAKPLASTMFVALASRDGLPDTPFGQALLFGFVGCWWGDVLLIPTDKRAFLAGIAAFALGHLGFALAFALRGVDPLPTCLALVALLPAGGWVLRWLRPRLAGPMRIAVPAYVAIICLMVALAAGTAQQPGTGNGPLLLLGALLFWLSDLCVARERFVASAFVNRAVGLPLYYGAVALLALAGGAP